MKIKTISRSEEAATRETRKDAVRTHKNPDPKLHPLEKAREYVRAVTAAKMERMFAKPFLSALSEHSDGVACSATSPTNLVAFLSGAADGEVILWDLAARRKVWSVYAHTGFVRGLTVAGDGENFFSCGDDRRIRQWRMTSDAAAALKGEHDVVLRGKRLRPAEGTASAKEPVSVWTGKHAFTCIDHELRTARFASSSNVVDIWDYNRSEPLHTYEWGADTVTSVRFNPAETGLLASTGADRSIVLYDVRTDSALRKVTLAMRSNALAWNPREPLNFSIASEDNNAYTFDMRKLDHALMVHKDHVGAVMDISYSPTGKEFVTGSYDRTVRIWRVNQGKSREVYHAQRMQRVFTVKYSGDAKYVISGSDDTNLRIWKADASAPLGRLLPQERAAIDYRNTLKKRFAHMPEVRRITTHRHVPKPLLNAKKARFDEEQRARKKSANVRAHSKPGSGAGVPDAERKKAIVMVSK